MACFHPLHGYFWSNPATGKQEAVIQKKALHPKAEAILPCGRCIGCRLEYSRQWAVRIMHEAQQWPENSYITLTYNDQHLPQQNQLKKKDFQDFMKRLRRANPGKTIRFYHCGEYGEQSWRPHYHACIFNHDFHDKEPLFHQKGNWVYKSEELAERWGKGHVSTGKLTFESAAYVARYVTKKINGAKAEEHYQRYDEFTDEYYQLVPEYVTMSRGAKKGLGGIGKNWYEKYGEAVRNNDEVIINGRPQKPPRYYDKLFEDFDPHEYELTKQERLSQAKATESERTPERLQQKEKLRKRALKQHTREPQQIS